LSNKLLGSQAFLIEVNRILKNFAFLAEKESHLAWTLPAEFVALQTGNTWMIHENLPDLVDWERAWFLLLDRTRLYG
jgi:hypothetical protein